MKVGESYDAVRDRERVVLTALVVDPTVLGKVAARWDDKLFAARWSNVVAGWCVKHLQKHQGAPKAAVQHYYREWVPRCRDPEEVEAVGRFLESLSDEYEKRDEDLNSSVILELADKHFNLVRATRLREDLEATLAADDAAKAVGLVEGFRPVEVTSESGVDPFTQPEARAGYFAKDKTKPLVVFPGALGELLNDFLVRDGFVSFLGPEKTGKSFTLQEIAYRALCQRRRVAFFECGDQAEHQIGIRLMVRAARRPFRSTNRGSGKWPCTVRVPRTIEPPEPGENVARVVYEDRVFDVPLTLEEADAACARVMKKSVRSDRSYFRLWCYPAETASVTTLRGELDRLARDGWVPDVVCVDYPDIMAPVDPHADSSREKIKQTWAGLRSLNQSYHCLLAVVTQADAESYEKRTLSRSNFSEDKRKHSFVTGEFGINVTGPEKEVGVCRYNCIMGRDRDFSWHKEVHVAQCLPLANPMVVSCWSTV